LVCTMPPEILDYLQMVAMLGHIKHGSGKCGTRIHVWETQEYS